MAVSKSNNDVFDTKEALPKSDLAQPSLQPLPQEPKAQAGPQPMKPSSSPAPIVSPAVPAMAPSTRLPKKCRFGKRCKQLLNGDYCNYLHTMEEMEAATVGKPMPVATPTNQKPRAPLIPSPETANATEVGGSDVTKKHETTIMISAQAASLVTGNYIRTIYCRTGATVRVLSKKVDADGFCPVSIRGRTQKNMERGAEMVEKKAAIYVHGTIHDNGSANETSSRLSSSISSDTGNVPGHVYTDSKSPCPSVATQSTPKKAKGSNKSPNRSGGSVDLPTFLRSHEKSLKCSSMAFFHFLHAEDIDTLEDLCEACLDEEFAEELVANGLKRFKLSIFRKSVAAAAKSADSAM
jgi:hypothetical protein